MNIYNRWLSPQPHGSRPMQLHPLPAVQRELCLAGSGRPGTKEGVRRKGVQCPSGKLCVDVGPHRVIVRDWRKSVVVRVVVLCRCQIYFSPCLCWVFDEVLRVLWIYRGCVNVCTSRVHMGGEREDLGFLMKMWEWGGFCAACSDSEISILSGL